LLIQLSISFKIFMKKVLIAGFATLTLLLPAFASAQTAADIQRQLNELISQLAKMQAQNSQSNSNQAAVTGTTNNSSNDNCQFARNLYKGLSGKDVACLQSYLIEEGFLNVSATGFFGSATFSAVQGWQSANGVSAVGIFGSVSRAMYARLIANAESGSHDDTSNAMPTPVPSSSFNASATIDPASLTTYSAMPTLSGYAYNIKQPFGITISNSGGKIWGSGTVGVTNNRWSVTVNQSLAAGSYQVYVYANNVLVATGTLTINSGAQTSLITVESALGDKGQTNITNRLIFVKWRTTGTIGQIGIGFCPVGESVTGPHCTMEASYPNTGSAEIDLIGGLGLYSGQWTAHVMDVTNRSVYGVSNAFSLSEAQNLSLSSVMPADAVPGTRVTVYGSGFNYATYIAIDGNYGTGIQPTAITLSGTSQLSFILPTGMSTGNHSMQAQEKAGSALSNTINFTVASQGPTLSYITPTTVKVGDTVWVYGRNFNFSTYATLDGTNVPIYPSATPDGKTGVFSFVVPSGASAGTHTLQVGEKGSSFPLSNSVNLTIQAPSYAITVTTPAAGQVLTVGKTSWVHFYNPNEKGVTPRYVINIANNNGGKGTVATVNPGEVGCLSSPGNCSYEFTPTEAASWNVLTIYDVANDPNGNWTSGNSPAFSVVAPTVSASIDATTLHAVPGYSFTLSGAISGTPGALTVAIVGPNFSGNSDWSTVSNLLKGSGTYAAVSNNAYVSGSSWSTQFGSIANEGYYTVLIYDSSFKLIGSGTLWVTYKG
jgi:hypothetical protein